MTWRQILERAARVSPETQRLMPPLAVVLDATARGKVNLAELRAVCGLPASDPELGEQDPWAVALASAPVIPPFLAALERAAGASARSWEGETLDAVRATFRELEPLLNRLVAVPYGAPLPTGTSSVQAALERLVLPVGRRAGKAESDAPACPRCLSPHIELRTGGEHDELLCHACGYLDEIARSPA